MTFFDSLHPAVAAWFGQRFPAGPTEPQRRAWPSIAAGHDVLVASPTGTGKTLTGFLMAINRAYQAAEGADHPAADSGDELAARIVYISPLRALAADVHENLQIPLAGIAEEARRLGLVAPSLRLAVRTGDTSSADRAAMRRSPPDLLVTTPESLYLMLTASSSRTMLADVRTVIVDEVHTVARDKRGSHLALSLERLDHLVRGNGGHLQRIGLSATQRPLDVVGRLLTGCHQDRGTPVVVDCGHQRDLDIAIELPPSELEAVASHVQLGQVLDRVAELVRQHRTTLVFVNTRRMAERLAHLLGERLDAGHLGGDPAVVAAHHGSLSPARRRHVEARLRAGDLRALVATASLELGIDVGPVELVCQIGSPRAIATFIQRVGRANHSLHGTPAGRLFPMTRDELVECTALLAAVRAGRLDALHPPEAPLDVLAQQMVAEVSAQEWDEDELYELCRNAAPYANMDRSQFDEVLDLAAWGIQTGRGRRGAHLHRDGVHHKVRARRGARLAALTGGGAIPETGDYRVVLDPDGSTVGSVHEDFAVEAAIGDVFLLGTHSWRVRKVETGTVRVEDAAGAAPTIPFWLGEAPARTAELSKETGDLRAAVDGALTNGDATGAREVVQERAGTSPEVADAVVSYLAAGRATLGTLPTHEHIVVERFFDETEGTQVVIHAPYGGAINRAFGLALRKRFCVGFDFELQAAADDDTVVLSLGPQHSFALEQVPRMLKSSTAADVLTQAVLAHPMLAARWRWNLNRALVVPRAYGGRRRPIHLQRMDADDVLAAAWPALAACQDNAGPGPVAIADHVLVRQTVFDCLHEALDVDGLVDLLAAIENGSVAVHLVESPEPSVLAHGILSGRPYTFLDGAPLEERRTRAVSLPRGLGTMGDDGLPVEARELAPLDEGAVDEVLATVRPAPRDRDELHDLLLSLVACRPVPAWSAWFAELVDDHRAAIVELPLTSGTPPDPAGCPPSVLAWVAAERRQLAETMASDDQAVAECVRGHLDLAGPLREEQLYGDGPLPSGAPRGAPVSLARLRTGLGRLEAEGSAVAMVDGRWCARHLLARLHRASRSRRRRAIEPATQSDLVRFLGRWQHVADGSKREGRQGLLSVIEQLQGTEVPAAEWEPSVLRARMVRYEASWLDELCLSGEVAWGRLTPRASTPGKGVNRRGSSTPSPATPLSLTLREDMGWLLEAVRGDEVPQEPTAGSAADVWLALSERGACFRSDLVAATRRLPTDVDEGLWELVTRGLATADAFSAVRSLLQARSGRSARSRHRHRRAAVLGAHRGVVGSRSGEGRWSLLLRPLAVSGDGEGGGEEAAELVAEQLLKRWGLVSWELWSRESFRLPWRDVVRALRRFEARGLVLGGRFVGGLSGEQYGLPEAVEILQSLRNKPPEGEELHVAAVDPLNLTGGVLPGTRVPARRQHSVVYRDGVPVGDAALH